MRLANRTISITPWLGVLLGLFLASLPIMATAVEFKPPKRGVPGRREGGGTRDPLACTQGNPSRLTALLPATNLGLTTAAYPRFFWFTPKTKAKLAEFTLFEGDETKPDRTLIYKTTFGIDGSAGIASLSLPKTATLPPLTVGKDYHWSLALVCNANDRKRDIRVDGWVQRVAPEPALAKQLTQATPDDRLRLYAANGLWFDTLATSADARCANPQAAAATTNWTELLESVGLKSIAQQPVQCEKP